MLLGAVAFMAAEAVFRMHPVDQLHPLVPDYLGHDRGASDRKTFGVPAHHCLHRKRAVARQAIAVDQDQVRLKGEFLERPDHRQVSRGQDADPVDLFGADGPHTN